jgi:hypothetical protein
VVTAPAPCGAAGLAAPLLVGLSLGELSLSLGPTPCRTRTDQRFTSLGATHTQSTCHRVSHSIPPSSVFLVTRNSIEKKHSEVGLVGSLL